MHWYSPMLNVRGLGTDKTEGARRERRAGEGKI